MTLEVTWWMRFSIIISCLWTLSSAAIKTDHAAAWEHSLSLVVSPIDKMTTITTKGTGAIAVHNNDQEMEWLSDNTNIKHRSACFMCLSIVNMHGVKWYGSWIGFIKKIIFHVSPICDDDDHQNQPNCSHGQLYTVEAVVVCNICLHHTIQQDAIAAAAETVMNPPSTMCECWWQPVIRMILMKWCNWTFWKMQWHAPVAIVYGHHNEHIWMLLIMSLIKTMTMRMMIIHYSTYQGSTIDPVYHNLTWWMFWCKTTQLCMVRWCNQSEKIFTCKIICKMNWKFNC